MLVLLRDRLCFVLLFFESTSKIVPAEPFFIKIHPVITSQLGVKFWSHSNVKPKPNITEISIAQFVPSASQRHEDHFFPLSVGFAIRVMVSFSLPTSSVIEYSLWRLLADACRSLRGNSLYLVNSLISILKFRINWKDFNDMVHSLPTDFEPHIDIEQQSSVVFPESFEVGTNAFTKSSTQNEV